jgi:flagellar protein FlaJ
MARKKKDKEKIRVTLDLPKDDNSEQTFQIILIISVLLGVANLGFWATNTDLIFQPANSMPQFINMACPDSFNPTIPVAPTFAENQSCQFTQEAPSYETWTEEWEKIGYPGMAKSFEVPGIPDRDLDGLAHPPILMSLNCEVLADQQSPYTIRIIFSDVDGIKNEITRYDGFANSDECGFQDLQVFTTVDMDREYFELYLEVEKGDPRVNSFEFEMTIETYDGVPEYMNDRSFWMGPRVAYGPVDLRPTLFVNFFGIGFLIMLFPASIYKDKQMKKIKDVEAKFPDFLRDLAEYWKGGLSMVVAVRTLANSEYGALNTDIKKMSDQLSWGVAFSDVLLMFADRVNTPLVKRAVSLVNEANRAGGKISDILVTAANDSREIKFLEGERARSIASYISVIWVSYFVFMGVIVVLSKVFIPAIASSNSGEESAQIGNMQINAVDPLFFLVVFFYGVSAQAIGNGAMAGLMATGRLSAGFKHSGFMLIIALMAFNFVAFSPDLIGVPELRTLSPSLGTYQPGG